jgi:hypothetical protein
MSDRPGLCFGRRVSSANIDYIGEGADATPITQCLQWNYWELERSLCSQRS